MIHNPVSGDRNMKSTSLVILFFMMFCVFGAAIQAAEKPTRKSVKGKVLVVVSSTNSLTLKDGKKHPTGFFLNELGVPTKVIVDAGFEPVFCNPLGNTPAMDTISDKPKYFGTDDKEYQAIKSFVEGLNQLQHPLKLADVAKGDLSQYAGLFVPGGHAPMEDLWKDPSLGKILRYLHEKHKPTALICHGPVALMSALDDPQNVVASIDSKDAGKADKKNRWPYAGYRMTVFSTAEEKPNEGEKATLGGFMIFYPEAGLKAAGGDVSVSPPGKSHVVVDRELITGQNPFSDRALAATLIQAISRK
jgi:putative intracellular protease/amidase